MKLILAFALATVAVTPSPQKEKAEYVLLEKMGQGRFDNLDRIYAPGFRAHAGDRTVDLAADNDSARAIRSAVPDLKVVIVRTVEQADLVAVHWRASGTNSVAAAGMPGKGNYLSIDGMTFFRFEDGRIIEEWSLADQAKMMRDSAK